MPFLVIQGYQNQKFSFPQPPVYSNTSKRYLLIYSGFSTGMYFFSFKATISCFFLCFFCLTPLRLECSRSRKAASFLTSHRVKKYKNLDPSSFPNGVKTW